MRFGWGVGKPIIDGKDVFTAKLQPGTSSNPFITFFMKVPGPGEFEFSWVGDAFPFGGLTQIFASGGESNFGKIGSPEIDAKIEQVLDELDADKARVLANELDRLIFALGIRHAGEAAASLLARHYGSWSAFEQAMTTAQPGTPEWQDLTAIDGVGTLKVAPAGNSLTGTLEANGSSYPLQADPATGKAGLLWATGDKSGTPISADRSTRPPRATMVPAPTASALPWHRAASR